MDELGIRVNYYEGAYSPWIRIDTDTLEELNTIKSIFLSLAEAGPSMVDFLDALRVTATGLDHLILERAEIPETVDKCLVRTETERGTVSFVWSLPVREWKRCAGLIDGIIEYNRPAHQYLTHEGVDDAIVVVALKEDRSRRNKALGQA